jgi:hypothetical protein
VPEPITFRIVQNLQAALAAIAIADGYFHDIAVTAVKLDPNVNVETLVGNQRLRPFVIIEVGQEPFEYQPAKRLKQRIPIIIHAVHDSDPTDDNSWLKTFTRLCADVEQAITKDISRGGVASDTRVLTTEFKSFEGQLVWALVSIEIHVHRTYGEPNG